jgi:hypothetical protein
MSLKDTDTLADEMKQRHDHGPPPDEHKDRRGQVYRLKNGEACTSLQWASEQMDVDVLKVEKIGPSKSQWYFTVKHADGSTREMDPIPGDRILEPTYMRKKIFQGTDLPPNRLKADEWDDVAAALAQGAVEREHGHDDRATWIERLRGHVKATLAESADAIDMADAKSKAEVVEAATSLFWDTDGRLWLLKEPFAKHLREQHLYVQGGEIGTGLTLAGIEPKKLSIRRRREGDLKGKVLTVQYYRTPKGFRNA